MTMRSATLEIDHQNADWPLSQPAEEDSTEPRVYRTHVAFDVPFANIPMIHAGVSGFDIDNRDTPRLSVRAEDISPSGFDLLISTWLNTRVYKVEINWIALGHQNTQ